MHERRQAWIRRPRLRMEVIQANGIVGKWAHGCEAFNVRECRD